MYRNKRALFGLVAALVLVMSASVSIQAAEMWHYWLSGGEKEALDAFLDKARELYPNVEFTERGIPGSTSEMRRQLGAAFMANDPPELYQSAIGYDMKSYVDAGRLEPIDDIWEAVNGDEIFSEGLQRMVKFDGHAYGIPLNTHVISHIFYNKHIFEKYDLDIPTTWDEFKEVSKTLRENGIEPFAAATSWTLTHFYAPLITVLGPEGYLALGNGELAFTDPKVREAFELYGDAFVSSYMFGWSGYGWAEAANELLQGNAAMYLNGDWVVAYFEQAGWTPGEDFGFFPAPGTEDAIIIQVDALAAPKNAKDTEGAKALMTVAGSIDGQSAFNKHKGSVAANLAVPPEIYNPILLETYNRIQRVNEEGTILPNQLFMLPPSLYQELGRQVEMYALNPTDKVLDGVLNTLENMRQDLLKENAFVKWQDM
ncbi:MAG: carbohydrate ABC transporter substrate-binding protein [Firmicutes bacterium]|nr:carbohydrate ABC transporter substrate-binding protein [Bacillota bacterium]